MKNSSTASTADTPGLLLIIPPAASLAEPAPGPAFLRSAVISAGLRCQVIDLNIRLFRSYVAEKKRWLWRGGFCAWSDMDQFEQSIIPWASDYLCRELHRHIDIFKPSVIGFSSSLCSYPATVLLANASWKRNPHTPVIVGGPVTNILISDISRLKPLKADALVVGEGEKAVVDMLQHARNRWPDLPGAILLPLQQPPAFRLPQPVPPSQIPVPDYRDTPPDQYLGRTTSSGHGACLPVQLTRGCIGRCAFCSETHIYSTHFKARDPNLILTEIEHAVKYMGVKRFYFCDLSINADVSALRHLLEGLINKKLAIEWMCEARPDATIDYDLAVLMKKSGCHSVGFGLESGSDRILKKMRKDFSVSQAEKALKTISEAGIHASVNLMAGFPGSSFPDIIRTIYFVLKNRKHIGNISSPVLCCTLNPDTPIGKYPEKFGIAMPAPDNGWHSITGMNNPVSRFLEQRALEFVAILSGLYTSAPVRDRHNPVMLAAMEWKRLGHYGKGILYSAFAAIISAEARKLLPEISAEWCMTKKKHQLAAWLLTICGAPASRIAPLLLDAGLYEKAGYHLKRVPASDSWYPEAQRSLGWIYEKNGSPDKALRAYIRSCNADNSPDNISQQRIKALSAPSKYAGSQSQYRPTL